MARYLWQGSFTQAGYQALLEEGGTARKREVEEYLGRVGGRVEAFYFSFGNADIWAIVEVPDEVAAAALSLHIGAGGFGLEHTTVLLTPEEIDEAVLLHLEYVIPGSGGEGPTPSG